MTVTSSAWTAQPPADVVLSPGVVDVWRIRLDRDERTLAEARAVLSPEEIERAGRYRLEDLQRRFLVAHVSLRCILGHYLGAKPSEIAFAATSYGKPFVRGAPARFNLSHSESLALVAVTGAGEVGVDVEFIRPAIVGEQIAERFFSPREVAALQALPEPLKPAAFFHCWTRKEAFIKALGEGLSHPLSSFDVSLDPDRATLLAVGGSAEAASAWTLGALAPGEGYAGAVAVTIPSVVVRTWDWSGFDT